MERSAQARPAIRIAAAGDLHVRPGLEARLGETLAALDAVDLVLLSGDLTATGEVAEARALAAACRESRAPIVAVLGNHDHHAGEATSIARALEETGSVQVLDGAVAILEVRGVLVGVAGTKGFVGGFRESRLPDFGERLLREVYAATGKEVDALADGLERISGCDHRIVLLHYAPSTTTLVGEREPVWTFLGSERLAGPVVRHRPDVVFHGHAHAGSFEGAIGSIPVFNVAWPVIGGRFAVWELAGAPRLVTPRPSPRAAANGGRPEVEAHADR